MERADERIQRAGLDGCPETGHEILIIVQIVPRQQHRAEDFVRPHQMMQIGPAIIPAGGTAARLVQWARVVAVADIPRTKSGKIVELAVRDIVHGREIKNREALANPEALELFRDLEALQV